MATFTPGKWIADAELQAVRLANGHILLRVAKAPGGCAEAEANLRLAAGAPDLLQIARSALSCWGFMASNMVLPANERQAATVMAQAARKAINLVEGGAE